MRESQGAEGGEESARGSRMCVSMMTLPRELPGGTRGGGDGVSLSVSLSLALKLTQGRAGCSPSGHASSSRESQRH